MCVSDITAEDKWFYDNLKASFAFYFSTGLIFLSMSCFLLFGIANRRKTFLEIYLWYNVVTLGMSIPFFIMYLIMEPISFLFFLFFYGKLYETIYDESSFFSTHIRHFFQFLLVYKLIFDKLL